MNSCEKYTPDSASAMQMCRLWSAHVDALERHLSANTWALAATTMLMIAYPVARMVIPAIVHGIVPDAVRSVLNLIEFELGAAKEIARTRGRSWGSSSAKTLGGTLLDEEKE